jgi:predicted phage terminase large subunit-like protein
MPLLWAMSLLWTTLSDSNSLLAFALLGTTYYHLLMTKEQIKAKMRGDMLLFGRICLPNMFTCKSPAFHREVAECLIDHEIKKLVVIAPRGHAKSSLVACVGVLHHIFFDEGPKVILLVSKTEGHANRLLQTIKNALDYSMTLRYLFGYWGVHSAKKWTTTEAILKDDTFIICKGMGQQVIGLKYNDQRPTLVVLDDPEDLENTKTEDRMRGNLEWLLASAVPGRDAIRGRVWVIGTPQHQRGLVNVLMKMEGWKGLHYHSLVDEVIDDKVLQAGILAGRIAPRPEWSLWHELWDAKKLLEEMSGYESIGKISYFYREYQCVIQGDEEQLFREEDILTYRGEFYLDKHGNAALALTHINGEQLEEKDIRSINVFTGVDPASSVAQTADYSVIMNVGIDQMGNRFVLGYYRKRVKPMALANAIIENFEKYRSQTTRVESTGYQEMLREYLQEESAKRNLYIVGLEIKEAPRQAKSRRIESMAPFFNNKQVLLPEEGCEELRSELELYPRSKNDDTLDALYYAFKRNCIPEHEGGEKASKDNGKEVDGEDEAYESIDFLFM